MKALSHSILCRYLYLGPMSIPLKMYLHRNIIFNPGNINVFIPIRTDRPALMQSYVGHSTFHLRTYISLFSLLRIHFENILNSDKPKRPAE